MASLYHLMEILKYLFNTHFYRMNPETLNTFFQTEVAVSLNVWLAKLPFSMGFQLKSNKAGKVTL